MTVIRIETLIATSPEDCFDLARDIDLHVASNAGTRERAVAVAGVQSGLIGLNGSVTWEAVHFGIRHSMTTKVTEYERPHKFVDEMLEGPFRSLRHVHEFAERDDATVMTDVFAYEVPFGLLGRLFDRLVLEPHMRRLVANRASFLRIAAQNTHVAAGATQTARAPS